MYRVYVNGLGGIAVECMPNDYVAAPGEVLLPTYPTDGELDARFPDAVLRDARRKARAEVSRAAEAARKQFVTPGSAKAMAYQEKAREAVAYLADPDPQAENYLLLASEVGVTAPVEEGILGVAQVVAGKYQLFRQIEAVIGGTEAAAQKTVKEAESVEAIDAVIAGLTWPTAPQEE